MYNVSTPTLENNVFGKTVVGLEEMDYILGR